MFPSFVVLIRSFCVIFFRFGALKYSLLAHCFLALTGIRPLATQAYMRLIAQLYRATLRAPDKIFLLSLDRVAICSIYALASVPLRSLTACSTQSRVIIAWAYAACADWLFCGAGMIRMGCSTPSKVWVRLSHVGCVPRIWYWRGIPGCHPVGPVCICDPPSDRRRLLSGESHWSA